jgi:hypothetical protein
MIIMIILINLKIIILTLTALKFIGIFFGLIYLQIVNNEIGSDDRNGLLFIFMMNIGFIFLFPILNVFAGEMPIYYRENKSKLYSTSIYYITKQIAEVIF